MSLHAANDALRNEIVPANRGFGIAAILAAADEYFEQTGRRVTFEYVLLADVNDRPEHAGELAKLLRGRPALLNLIPYNPVPGLPYRTPSSSVTARFVEILTQAGLNVNIRHRKGDRIAAACGQLRRGAAVSDLLREGYPTSKTGCSQSLCRSAMDLDYWQPPRCTGFSTGNLLANAAIIFSWTSEKKPRETVRCRFRIHLCSYRTHSRKCRSISAYSTLSRYLL